MPDLHALCARSANRIQLLLIDHFPIAVGYYYNNGRNVGYSWFKVNCLVMA